MGDSFVHLFGWMQEIGRCYKRVQKKSSHPKGQPDFSLRLNACYYIWVDTFCGLFVVLIAAPFVQGNLLYQISFFIDEGTIAIFWYCKHEFGVAEGEDREKYFTQ